MIVLTLIAVLVSIAVPMYRALILRSRESTLKVNLHSLRDVLDQSARDAASALSTSVAAVNSALQRSRDGLREHLPADRLQWACEPPSASQLRALRRYLRELDS